MKILSFLVLTLALLNGNAFSFQIADGQYQSTKYNNVRLSDYQTAFNGIRSRGAGGGAPVGTIVAVPSYAVAKFLEEDPTAWLPCDGVTSTAGTALATIMTVTPPLNGEGRFLQGTNGTSSTVAAGLPNITGKMGGESGLHGYAATSALYAIGGGDGGFWGAGSGATTFGFDASRSSPVYRNDIDTVQPKAYTVRYYIRCNE